MPDFASSKVLGYRLPDELHGAELIRLVGTEGVSELFDFRIDFVAPRPRSVSYNGLLGRDVSITLGNRQQTGSSSAPTGEMQQRHIHGMICSVVEQDRHSEFVRFQLSVVPRVWGLTQTYRRRIFQESTIPQILEAVFANTGIEFRLRHKYYDHNYCVQYDESDFAFASRLMEETGLHYYFEHSESAHRMVIADTLDSAHSIPGDESLVYRPKAADWAPTEAVHRWCKEQHMGPTSFALNDYSFELPTRGLRVEHRIDRDIQVGKVRHELGFADRYPGGGAAVEVFPAGFAHRFDSVDVNGRDHAKELPQIFELNAYQARDFAEESVAARLWIDADSDCSCVLPGRRFRLSGHEHGDGEYFITRVEHSVDLAHPRLPNEPVTNYSNRFRCMPTDWSYRPLRKTPTPHARGTETALVIGPGDEEISTDRFGRVRVRFHWDSRENGKNGTCWLRVAQPWTGKNFGQFALPRVGSEVVVDFLNGDPDQPIVIGSVYNAEQMPPFQMPAERTLTGIKTRTYRGDQDDFHGMYFDDANGSEMIRLRSQKDVLLEAKHEVVVAAPNGLTTRSHGYNLQVMGGLATGGGSGSGSGGAAESICVEIVSPPDSSGAGGDAPPPPNGPEWFIVPNVKEGIGLPLCFCIVSTLGVNNLVTVGMSCIYNVFHSSVVTVDPTEWLPNLPGQPVFGPLLAGITGSSLVTHANTAMLSYGSLVKASHGDFIETFATNNYIKVLSKLHALTVMTAAILPNLHSIPGIDHFKLAYYGDIGTFGLAQVLQAMLTKAEQLKARAVTNARRAVQAVVDPVAVTRSTDAMRAASLHFSTRLAAVAAAGMAPVPAGDAAEAAVNQNQATTVEGAWTLRTNEIAAIDTENGIRIGVTSNGVSLARGTVYRDGIYLEAPAGNIDAFTTRCRLAVRSDPTAIAFIGAPGMFNQEVSGAHTDIPFGVLATTNRVALNRRTTTSVQSVALDTNGITIALMNALADMTTAKKIVISDTGITMSCGGNTAIELTPTGITMRGQTIQLNGNTSMNVQAAAIALA